MILGEYGHGGDIYKNRVEYDFSANVNPLGTPSEVVDAICESTYTLSRYPDPYCGELRRKLAGALSVSVDDIICANGAAELIFQFVQAVKPKNALLPVPSFSEYETALLSCGANVRHYHLLRENGFVLKEDILPDITPDIDILILCNPNNPTGITIEKPLMLRIIDRCRETGTWLMLDECFIDLTDEQDAYTILPFMSKGDKIFVLRAFTKLYGMAGVRLGYGVCRQHEILDNMCMLIQPWNVSTLAQAAGIAALDCIEFVKKTRKLITTEREYLENSLNDLKINFIKPQANYILLRGRPDWGDKLLEKGILVRSCKNYNGLDDSDYRIAVRTHEENEVLIKALKSLIKEK